MKNQLIEFEELSSREMKNYNGGSFYYPISNYDGIYSALKEGVDAFVGAFKDGYNNATKNGGRL